MQESVGAPGVPLSQRLPKLDQEGMDLTPDLGSSMRTSNKGLDALHCTDPLTQVQFSAQGALLAPESLCALA